MFFSNKTRFIIKKDVFSKNVFVYIQENIFYD